MTWRDVLEQLKQCPDEVLDMQAYVWLYEDGNYGQGNVVITSLSPYDSDAKPSVDNELSFDLEER